MKRVSDIDKYDIAVLAEEHRQRLLCSGRDMFAVPEFSAVQFDSISQVGSNNFEFDRQTVDISSGSCLSDMEKISKPTLNDIESKGGKEYILDQFFRSYIDSSAASSSTDMYAVEKICDNSTDVGIRKEDSDVETQELAIFFSEEFNFMEYENSGSAKDEPSSPKTDSTSCSKIDISSCSSKGNYYFYSGKDELRNTVEAIVKGCLEKKGLLAQQARPLTSEVDKDVVRRLRRKLQIKLKGSMGNIESQNQNHGSIGQKPSTSGTQQSRKVNDMKEKAALHKKSHEIYNNKRDSLTGKKKSRGKFIPGTRFIVDNFDCQCPSEVDGYFLTHFHPKHYRGLNRSFKKVIYCSDITAKLINSQLDVSCSFLQPLAKDKPHIISDVEVTLLDANHCPGSVMILFKPRNGKVVLHVGHFRAIPRMEELSSLCNCSIDTLYLDTTYCQPMNNFPSRNEIVRKCLSIASFHVVDNKEVLIIVGSYIVGQEPVIKAIACALDCKIWAMGKKQETLRSIGDEELMSRLTTDKLSARVHVLPMTLIHPMKLSNHLIDLQPIFSVGVAFRLSGWENCDQEISSFLLPKQHGNIYIYGIPYSDHSSYQELKRFVRFLQPKKILPTVSAKNRKVQREIKQILKEWIQDV